MTEMHSFGLVYSHKERKPIPETEKAKTMIVKAKRIKRQKRKKKREKTSLKNLGHFFKFPDIFI